MREASKIPRLLVVMSAVVVAGVILRVPLSSALVIRGDDYITRGDMQHAEIMYDRAITLDSENENAVDREAFRAILTHNKPNIAHAIRLTTRYLQDNPRNVTVLMDRALAFQLLRQYSRATRDFAAAGELSKDGRALTFAALDALHDGKLAAARSLLKRAIRVDPRFGLARVELHRLS
jgi:tetratricopeptide (TPR) repeat protein